eukprot:TRINITY_DN68141_c0_g1_i1.p1 TRINITY_DN68141_c0_g1~~TRINITY_DN68141_c0_g1_i1.p1  ORF type:complete len:404 (-),score=75.36 TRINITY_DN68141_c0_g1_i1:38-1249(-)
MTKEARDETPPLAEVVAEEDFARLADLVQNREAFLAKGAEHGVWESRREFLEIMQSLWVSASQNDGKRQAVIVPAILERNRDLLFRAYGHAVCSRRRSLWTMTRDAGLGDDEFSGSTGDVKIESPQSTPAPANASGEAQTIQVEVRGLSGDLVFRGDLPATATACCLRNTLATSGVWGVAADDGAKFVLASGGRRPLVEADFLWRPRQDESRQHVVEDSVDDDSSGSSSFVSICLVRNPRRAGLPSICKTLTSLLSSSLLPLAVPRLKVLCYLMAGDVWRCAGDLATPVSEDEVACRNAAMDAYKKSRRVAEFACQGYDPIWLGLMLQLSMLYSEGLPNLQAAIDVAWRTIQDARSAGGGNVPQEWFQEADWFMRRLRENLIAWNSPAQDAVAEQPEIAVENG